jgi:hypothetical protein
MPRLREAFSLYKRRTPKGKVVYYFRAHDEKGNRLPGRSTGKTNKKDARDYCDNLKATGRLTKPGLRTSLPVSQCFSAGTARAAVKLQVRSRSCPKLLIDLAHTVVSRISEIEVVC